MSESPPKSGRFGTFDNRYRYDHIYPRGRSGETLRAWDTQDNERAVVIKRPAPQDAPPMRAAQEVSIRNERRALERLAGHSVLSELRGTGTFRVGGQTHEYIVIDRAEGNTVADLVLELAERGERLPTLEMLVIVDQLLDLLILAHDQQLVYNDVDAKHLFWNRDSYRLKVIDWGNAVMLDESNPQGITRQADVYQIGELLYTIVSGGKRLDSETTPDGEHTVLFGLDSVHVPATMQALINRATHPSIRKRYTTLIELRQHLNEIRRPLAERRDSILSEIRRELSGNNSHQELAELMERIEKAWALDPGYPDTHQLYHQIESEQRRLETQAHIDAARIYLDTANWPRAIETMLDLLDDAGPQLAPVIRFIIAAAELLDSNERTSAPPLLSKAIDELLRGDMQQAGVLLATASPDEDYQLLAERLVALVPSVLLLRPPLARIRAEAKTLPNGEDINLVLDKIDSRLNQAPDDINLKSILQFYRDLAPLFEDMGLLLEGAGEAGDRLLEILTRSQQALSAIVNHLQTISSSAYSEAARAGDALRQISRIDPQNQFLSHLNDYFEEVHLAVSALSSYKPKADGSDLLDWFSRVLNLLTPYGDDLQDSKLHQALNALQSASRLWSESIDGFILGQRLSLRSNLGRIAKLMEPLNHSLEAWANDLAEKSQNIPHVEALSPKTKLAQALNDGYRLWDQGKYSQVSDIAEKAQTHADSKGEKQALDRLLKLGQIPEKWLKSGGVTAHELTDQSEREIVSLFLSAEQLELNSFTEQMPTENAYLKTMGKGIIDYMRQSSTAAVRILFLHYTWRGLLCVQEGDLNGAEFWREAALKTIAEGRSNPVFAEFDTLLTGRKLVLEAEAALNKVQSPKDLAGLRNLLNQPLADQWLNDAQRAIRQLELGVRNWEDGDFRASREAFESALHDLDAGEKRAQIDLSKLRAWVKPLHESVASLQTSRLKLEEIAHSTRIPAPGEPVPANPVVAQVLQSIVESTAKYLGADYTHQVRQWQTTYQAVLATHQSESLDRTAKLVEYQAHFAGLFINRHPTYRLFQIWREAAQNMPDTTHSRSTKESPAIEVPNPEAPHTASLIPPVPDEPDFVESSPSKSAENGDSGLYYDEPRSASRIPWGTLITLAIVIGGVLAFTLMGGFGKDEEATPTPEISRNSTVAVMNPSPTENAITVPTTSVPASPTVTLELSATLEASPTDNPTETPSPTETPEPLPTTAVPTEAPTAETGNTSLLTNLPTDVLRSLNSLSPTDYTWDKNWFGPGAGGLWQLGGSEAIVGSGPLVVKMPPDFLATLYGTQAAERLSAIEIEMQLTLPVNPAAGVFFGLGLENNAGQRASAEIRITGQNLVSWGITENTGFRERSQIPTNDLKVTARLVRDFNTGVISLYIDNQLLGESAARYSNGVALTPVLYTSGGGVFVVVSRLQYEFNPIQ